MVLTWLQTTNFGNMNGKCMKPALINLTIPLRTSTLPYISGLA
ncbi:hypothetical protein Gohar_000363 [Gossypium harknessii]|uniref:Uncharacterized protein n=1 Tax=Gossypium harknessii TaxID=34285 RepID=A0A7J9I0E6_9ROSI|nr:hypothetical protein [Gossypium harknessii]